MKHFIIISLHIAVSVGKLLKRRLECLNFLLRDEDLGTKKICEKVMLSFAFFLSVFVYRSSCWDFLKHCLEMCKLRYKLNCYFSIAKVRVYKN